MTSWFNDDIHANGIRIHYTRTGGAKPPLLLLHGLTDNGLCWTPIAKALEGSYDIIMPDARGHGLSDGPGADISVQTLAADAAGLIQALQLEQVYLLGHSMGGATAAAVAARYPELVRAVLLEDPAWRDELPDAEPNQEDQAIEHNSWLEWLLPVRALSREERIAEVRAQTHWSDEELGPWADSKAQLNLETFQGDTFATFQLTGWREQVSQIRCPLLLLTGDPDRGAIVTPQIAEEAARLWHNGELLHIPGVGHNIRREQHDTYVAAITDFLQQH
jgi:N-formylmaleamate deformylase